jgi:hypothetical protein
LFPKKVAAYAKMIFAPSQPASQKKQQTHITQAT